MSDRCFVDPDRASRCGQAVRRLGSAEDEARNETATRSSTALRERPFRELAFRELCGRGARAASRANALGSASASSRGRESRLWRARDSSVRERMSTYARSANRVLRVPGRFVDEPVATTSKVLRCVSQSCTVDTKYISSLVLPPARPLSPRHSYIEPSGT